MADKRRIGWLALLIMALLGGGGLANPAPAAASLSASIVLITSDRSLDPLSSYLAEILRAEGWMSPVLQPLATLTLASLQPNPLVILPRTPLSAAQHQILNDYVASGGRLIALRPDTQLAPVFGLNALGSSQTDGYLAIDPTTTIGAGLPGAALQIHGQSDHYTLSGALTLATLAASRNSPSSYPAVVTNGYGRGQAAAFTYDLASNVALTRQGNPANPSYVNPISKVLGDIDGDGVTRTTDSFMGQSGAAPWVDRDLIAVPQADIQQRLLSRLIEQLSPIPLPRLWYHPDGKKTVLVLTGDAHANPLRYYTKLLQDIGGRGGHMTIYLSKTGELSTAEGRAWVQQAHAAGHTFGIHPYANKPDNYPTPITSLTQGYDDLAGGDGSGGWFAGAIGQPISRSVRHHQVAWQGWTEAAAIAAAHGIGLDTNFYTWGNWLKRPDGSWPHGTLTGSVRPMRLISAAGTLLPVYQQATQLIDEQLFQISTGQGEHLTAPQAIAVAKQLIDASERGDYGVLMTQFHVDYFGFSEVQTWADATIEYAISQGIPVWNADQLLNFTETRAATRFSATTWDPASATLRFTFQSSTASGARLSVILPQYAAAPPQSVLVDGQAQTRTSATIDGQIIQFLNLLPGTHTIELRYAAPVSTPTSLPTASAEPLPTSTSVPPPPSPVPSNHRHYLPLSWR